MRRLPYLSFILDILRGTFRPKGIKLKFHKKDSMILHTRPEYKTKKPSFFNKNFYRFVPMMRQNKYQNRNYEVDKQ